MSNLPSATLSLTPEQQWTLHHVLLDRIDEESRDVTTDADPPSVEVFHAFEMLESSSARFTLSQLTAIRELLAEYHHSPTLWEVERPQLEQVLHCVTYQIGRLEPSLCAD